MENGKYSCCICPAKIDRVHYAIRDMKPYESYFEWLWRHFVGVVTLRLGAKYATILPVCDNCAKTRMSYNIAEEINRTAQ